MALGSNKFSGVLGGGANKTAPSSMMIPRKAAVTTPAVTPTVTTPPAQRLSPGVYNLGGKTVLNKTGNFGANTVATNSTNTPTTTTTTNIPGAESIPEVTGSGADTTETTLRGALAKVAKNTPEYWTARAALNDYLQSTGKPTRILPGEAPYTGKSQYAKAGGPLAYVPSSNDAVNPNGTTPAGSSPYFPGIEAFKPENYMNSETFKLDLEDGTDFLNRQLSMAGLTGSGFNAEQKLKLFKNTRAAAQEKAISIAQAEADRYERIAEAQAKREFEGQTQEKSDYWDHVLELLKMGTSLYDINDATKGAENKANLDKWFGSAMAQFAKDGQPRATGGATGGGGGTLPFIPPFPGAPNTSATDLAGILAGGSSDANVNNSILAGLNQLLK